MEYSLDSDLEKFDYWTDALTDFKQSFDHSHRIHLVGLPNIGKTTFMHKICYHCATNDCPQLSMYDLVVYIDLAIILAEQPFVQMVDCIKRQLLDANDSEPGNFDFISRILRDFCT